MTLQYRDSDGWTRMVCNTCTKVTDFYATQAELYEATHFGAPITTDAGAVSWIYGPGRKIVGPAWTPAYQADPSKHICASCKGFIDGLVYSSDYGKFTVPVANKPKFGDAARISRDEDYQMNKDVEAIMKASKQAHPTPIKPRIFPRGEPDMSHDESFKEFGPGGEDTE
jgi:hypothetical protein